MISDELRKYFELLLQKDYLEELQESLNQEIIKKIIKVRNDVYIAQKLLSENDWQIIKNRTYDF